MSSNNQHTNNNNTASRSSIELVDRNDRNQHRDDLSVGSAASSRRGGGTFYNKLRGKKKGGDDKSDLFLTIEHGGHRDDDDRSVSSTSSYMSATSRDGIMKLRSVEDYTGLELDQMLKVRRRRICIKVILVVFAVVVLVMGVSTMNKKKKESSSSQHGSSSSQNDNDNKTPTVLDGPSIHSQADDDGAVEVEEDDVVGDDDEEYEDDDAYYNEDTTSMIQSWPTSAPLPVFEICAPPKASSDEESLPIVHLGDLIIVPEAEKIRNETTTNDDDDDGWYTDWTYTFSDMDIDEKASIIAVGMNDFSGPPSEMNEVVFGVGLVRAFGWSCDSQSWVQVGQDLLGQYEGEMFGSHISSSKDGKVMAISAPQENYSDGQGFVEVYYLDSDSTDDALFRWTLLGSRIENLKDTNYYNLGHAMDLSDRGETLAVLGIMETDGNDSDANNEYIIRVFDYDSNTLDWVRKGHDLKVALNYADNVDYYPHLSLSLEGDKLTLLDPEEGFITYHFEFETDQWNQKDTKGVKWNKVKGQTDDDDNISNKWWITEHTDMDDSGNLIGFAAFSESGGGDLVKVVDFTNASHPIGVYQNDFQDYTVNVDLAVSADGQVATIVASRWDQDDQMWFLGMGDYVGSLVVVVKNTTDSTWYELGKGTAVENMGVPGDFVAVSGDGSIAAVGSNTLVALYSISTNGNSNNVDEGDDVVEPPPTTNTAPAAGETTTFPLCTPFDNGEVNTNVGDLSKGLPKQPKQHTMSIALSNDGSVLVVGIDSYFEDNDNDDDTDAATEAAEEELDTENANSRGLVRVFGWSCQNNTYMQLGQDLMGAETFDGFGQSVDVSADGKTIVVGANQPPPGKSGYVEVYTYHTKDQVWKLVGDQIVVETDKADQEASVHDIGRQVRISDDGTVVLFLGGIVETSAIEEGVMEYICESVESFVRVVELNNSNKWQQKGSDLIGSIQYDSYGTECRVSLSGDGSTVAVTGSYSNFTAKVQTWNDKEWVETIIPPFKSTSEDPCDEWDEEYEEYFDGSDIALDVDGDAIAIAGRKWAESEPTVRVMTWSSDDKKYTLSHDAIGFDGSGDYTPSSVALSSDGTSLVAGINSHEASQYEQGAMFIAKADDSDSGWDALGTVDGKHQRDLLASRVALSGDGTLAAASSRRGYVRFFKLE